MSLYKPEYPKHVFKKQYVLTDGSKVRDTKPMAFGEQPYFKAFIRQTNSVQSERLKDFLDVIPKRFVYEIEDILVRNEMGTKDGDERTSFSLHARRYEEKLEETLAKWLALNEPLYRALYPADPNRLPPVLTYPYTDKPVPLPQNWAELADSLRLDTLLPLKKDDTLPKLPNGEAVHSEMKINYNDKNQKKQIIDWLADERIAEMKAAKDLSKRYFASKPARIVSFIGAGVLICATATYGLVMNSGLALNLWPKQKISKPLSTDTVQIVSTRDSSITSDLMYDIDATIKKAVQEQNNYPDYTVLQDAPLCKSRRADADAKDLSGKPTNDCNDVIKKGTPAKILISFGMSKDSERVYYVLTRDGKRGFVRNLQAVKQLNR